MLSDYYLTDLTRDWCYCKFSPPRYLLFKAPPPPHLRGNEWISYNLLWSVSHSIRLTHRVTADGQSITSIYWELVILNGFECDAELSHWKLKLNISIDDATSHCEWSSHHLRLRALYGLDRHYRHLHIPHVMSHVFFCCSKLRAKDNGKNLANS